MLKLALLATVCLLVTNTSGGETFRPTAQEKIVPPGAKLELLWSEGTFTEGPAAMSEDLILFTDIGNRIMRFDLRTRRATVVREPSGRANGLAVDADGRLIACEGADTGGRRRVTLTAKDGPLRVLASQYKGKRLNSPNDLAITRGGRVYFTDPRYGDESDRELDFEGVFVVDREGSPRLATRDVRRPNGILVSPSEDRVYVADNARDRSSTHDLVAFEIKPDGTLHQKRRLFSFPASERDFDGMALDSVGNIYATRGSGSSAGVYVFSPHGEPLAVIKTPGDPTNCEFGLGKHAKTLFITAAVPSKRMPTGKRAFGLYSIQLSTEGHNLAHKSLAD